MAVPPQQAAAACAASSLTTTSEMAPPPTSSRRGPLAAAGGGGTVRPWLRARAGTAGGATAPAPRGRPRLPTSAVRDDTIVRSTGHTVAVTGTMSDRLLTPTCCSRDGCGAGGGGGTSICGGSCDGERDADREVDSGGAEASAAANAGSNDTGRPTRSLAPTPAAAVVVVVPGVPPLAGDVPAVPNNRGATVPTHIGRDGVRPSSCCGVALDRERADSAGGGRPSAAASAASALSRNPRSESLPMLMAGRDVLLDVGRAARAVRLPYRSDNARVADRAGVTIAALLPPPVTDMPLPPPPLPLPPMGGDGDNTSCTTLWASPPTELPDGLAVRRATPSGFDALLLDGTAPNTNSDSSSALSPSNTVAMAAAPPSTIVGDPGGGGTGAGTSTGAGAGGGGGGGNNTCAYCATRTSSVKLPVTALCSRASCARRCGGVHWNRATWMTASAQ